MLIAVIAAGIAILGAWLVAKSWRTRAIVFGLAILAGFGYALTGKPDRPDQPLSGRIEALEQTLKQHPDQLTAEQLMLVAQRNAQTDPQNPAPHYAMGYILERTGKQTEAVLAFESALRRDPKFEPAMVDLADLNFELSGGKIDAYSMQLYQQAYALAPSDARIGYMIGIGEWQAGQPDQAKARWADLEAKAPQDDKVLRTLADDLFQTTGKIDLWTLEFYRTLYQQHPDQLQLGYLEGVGLWQTGDHDGAEKLWASIEAKAPKGDTTMPRMFAALKNMAQHPEALDQPGAPQPGAQPDGAQPQGATGTPAGTLTGPQGQGPAPTLAPAPRPGQAPVSDTRKPPS